MVTFYQSGRSPNYYSASVQLGIMTFQRNVGGIDRIARTILAVVFLGIGVLVFTDGRQALGAGVLIAGAGLGFNAVSGFCGLNAMLGVNTCTRDSAES